MSPVPAGDAGASAAIGAVAANQETKKKQTSALPEFPASSSRTETRNPL
jgi:hypothetical protein